MPGVESGSSSFEKEWTMGATNPDSGATGGDGGWFMPEYFQSRKQQLQLYSNIRTNNSQFSPPPGLTGANWEMSPTDDLSEVATGIKVSGTFLQADDSPLSGEALIVVGDPEQTVTLEWGNEEVVLSGVVAEKNVSGSFRIQGAPPAGIFAGEDGDTALQTMSVIFNPHTPGVSFQEEFETFRTDIGRHQYGEAYGRIVDHEGEPVGGVGVDAPGTGTNSGADGLFRLAGPAGESITIVTLNGTVEDSLAFQLEADPDNAQEFQFPALTIKVVDAEYAPVDSAPVTVAGETYYTDEEGTLTLSPVGLGEYQVTVMESFEGVVSLTEQGVDYQFQFGPDSTLVDWEPDPGDGLGGVKLTALDNDSGVQIRGIAATVPDQGIVSESGEDGVVKLLSSDVGEESVVIQLGSGDMRYAPTDLEIEEMPDGEMVEADVHLERKNQVVNF